MPRRARLDLGLAMLLVAYAALHLLLLRSAPVDSDEPQHLHVVWAWSQGLVPYRDTFDNHAPLFHLIYAPLLRLVGETPDVLLWMRLAIIPLAVAAIGCTALVGRRLWNRRVALWGATFACAFPPYLLVSSQFRADALWATLWIASLLVALSGHWSWRRGFWFGLLLGAVFASSLKTLALVGGLAIAWPLVQFALPSRLRASPGQSLVGVTAILGGLLVVPALVVGLVASRGGLAAMWYGVVQHNLLPGLGRGHGDAWRPLLLLPALAMLAVATRRVVRTAVDPVLAARRCLVVVPALAYLLLLFAFWPLLTRQDMLPCLPLLLLGLTGWWLGGRERAAPAWVSAVLVGIGLLFVAWRYPPWADRTASFRASLADVLALTTPQDPVMDAKGQAIYRVRPYYYVLEDITRARIRRGLIIDDIPSRLVATDTQVLLPLRLPARDMPFIQANYIDIGDGVMVAGHDFGQLPAGAVRSVRIQLPGWYALVGGTAADPIQLDGLPCKAAHWLGKGRHVLAFARAGHYALVWHKASALLQLTTGVD